MTYWPKVPEKPPLLYIHIPKTAGTSIRSWMRRQYGKCFTKIHAPIKDEEIANLGIPSFTVIRNPYDRSLSYYKYRKQILEENQSEHPGLREELKCWNDGFESWMVEYFKKPWVLFDKISGNRIHNPIGTGDLCPYLPQLDWMTIDSEIKVDHILRYENLDNDFKVIQRLIGNNQRLAMKNQSSVIIDSYKSVYTPVARRIVEDLHGVDLETFKYRF